jgi:hypothetical protein
MRTVPDGMQEYGSEYRLMLEGLDVMIKVASKRT